MTITLQDVIQADENWRKFFKDAPNNRMAMPQYNWDYINQFLGQPFGIMLEEMNDSQISRLRMLLSPYHETILKAYCIKSGIQWKPSHCKYGHKMTETNTYITTNGEGRQSKACKLCRSARRKLKYRENKLNEDN